MSNSTKIIKCSYNKELGIEVSGLESKKIIVQVPDNYDDQGAIEGILDEAATYIPSWIIKANESGYSLSILFSLLVKIYKSYKDDNLAMALQNFSTNFEGIMNEHQINLCLDDNMGELAGRYHTLKVFNALSSELKTANSEISTLKNEMEKINKKFSDDSMLSNCRFSKKIGALETLSLEKKKKGKERDDIIASFNTNHPEISTIEDPIQSLEFPKSIEIQSPDKMIEVESTHFLRAKRKNGFFSVYLSDLKAPSIDNTLKRLCETDPSSYKCFETIILHISEINSIFEKYLTEKLQLKKERIQSNTLFISFESLLSYISLNNQTIISAYKSKIDSNENDMRVNTLNIVIGLVIVRLWHSKVCFSLSAPIQVIHCYNQIMNHDLVEDLSSALHYIRNNEISFSLLSIIINFDFDKTLTSRYFAADDSINHVNTSISRAGQKILSKDKIQLEMLLPFLYCMIAYEKELLPITSLYSEEYKEILKDSDYQFLKTIIQFELGMWLCGIGHELVIKQGLNAEQIKIRIKELAKIVRMENHIYELVPISNFKDDVEIMITRNHVKKVNLLTIREQRSYLPKIHTIGIFKQNDRFLGYEIQDPQSSYIEQAGDLIREFFSSNKSISQAMPIIDFNYAEIAKFARERKFSTLMSRVILAKALNIPIKLYAPKGIDTLTLAYLNAVFSSTNDLSSLEANISTFKEEYDISYDNTQIDSIQDQVQRFKEHLIRCFIELRNLKETEIVYECCAYKTLLAGINNETLPERFYSYSDLVGYVNFFHDDSSCRIVGAESKLQKSNFNIKTESNIALGHMDILGRVLDKKTEISTIAFGVNANLEVKIKYDLESLIKTDKAFVLEDPTIYKKDVNGLFWFNFFKSIALTELVKQSTAAKDSNSNRAQNNAEVISKIMALSFDRLIRREFEKLLSIPPVQSIALQLKTQAIEKAKTSPIGISNIQSPIRMKMYSKFYETLALDYVLTQYNAVPDYYRNMIIEALYATIINIAEGY